MSQQLTFDLCGREVKGAPLLKWPGGKRSLLKHILPLLPESFNRYYEPFAGGAALFFALQPGVAVLSDNNPDLINCYIQVRDHPEEVIAHLKKLKNTEHDYYKIRGKVPTGEAAKAARFIYLLSLSFNGIHRSNLKGEFNVPYGRNTNSQFCNPVKIQAASVALSSAELRCEDFESAVADAKSGDVIYIDPPYTVAHGKNGFIKYNAKIFSWDDQIRLANLARDLVNRGCKVIVSNAHHSSILNIYKDFKLEVIRRTSTIAASGEFRCQIEECLFHNEINTYAE